MTSPAAVAMHDSSQHELMLAVLEAMQQAAGGTDEEIAFSDGHSSRIQHLGGNENGQPAARAFHIRGFLGQGEAAELISEAQAQPGGPQLSRTERDKAGGEEWRNSKQVWVPRGQHPDTSALVRSINQRTAELTRKDS